MIAKHSILFLFFACSIHGMHTSAFATTLFLTHSREKKSSLATKNKQKKLLFTQAERHEKDFNKYLTECLNYNNCETHEAYQQARYDVLQSILQLMTHIDNLKHNTSSTCYTYEKSEAKEMKNRLSELLIKNQ